MADKINKLSDAIRLGATFHQQCRDTYCRLTSGRQVLATCALGAAMEATGFDFGNVPIDLQKINIRFPDVPLGVLTDIVRKNDSRRQSREEIADWVEQQGY